MLTIKISTPQPVSDADGNGEFMPRGRGGTSDPVSATAEKRDKLLRDIRMIEQAAKMAAGDLAPYMLQAVTRRQGIQRIISDGCPVSERTFYRMRRLFFHSLKELRENA